MIMPTQEQMDQVTQQAVSSLSCGLGISEHDVLTNYQHSIFHLVCAFAAAASVASSDREARRAN